MQNAGKDCAHECSPGRLNNTLAVQDIASAIQSGVEGVSVAMYRTVASELNAQVGRVFPEQLLLTSSPS